VNLEGVVDVACGGSFCLALTEEGFLYAWGKNYSGQLGVGDESRRFEPTKVDFFDHSGTPVTKKIVAFGAMCEHAYALFEDGRLFMWGCPSDGRLGLGILLSNSNTKIPNELRDFKFRLPKNLIQYWAPVFSWFFLGREDRNSEFFGLPVEVVYNMVGALDKWTVEK
jgi:alpha-tubulin suppressor-like RCC1 family protein